VATQEWVTKIWDVSGKVIPDGTAITWTLPPELELVPHSIVFYNYGDAELGTTEDDAVLTGLRVGAFTGKNATAIVRFETYSNPVVVPACSTKTVSVTANVWIDYYSRTPAPSASDSFDTGAVTLSDRNRYC
jgi:hypothetical protein